MPLIDNSGWHAAVGPRMLFSELDGTYIADDLRHRAVLLSRAPDFGCIKNRSDVDWLYQQYCESQASKRLADSELEANFEVWVDNCSVRDMVYRAWLDRLVKSLKADSTLFPTRQQRQAPSQSESKVFLSALRTIGDVEFRRSTEASPPGTAASGGAAFGKKIYVSPKRTGDIVDGVAVKAREVRLSDLENDGY